MPRDDHLADPNVTKPGPLVEIEFTDKVFDDDGVAHAHVRGEQIKKGKRYLVEAPEAMAVLQVGHARIVGSESDDDYRRRMAKLGIAVEGVELSNEEQQRRLGQLDQPKATKTEAKQ